MQPVNIERGLAAIEAKLQDRKCLPHLLALARKHPEDINKYLSLAESIDSDLSARCTFSLLGYNRIATTVKVTEEREKCETTDVELGCRCCLFRFAKHYRNGSKRETLSCFL